ncbi:rifin PIR protein, putative [Plasmodium reichenowi]|uniref:Rifin PIR protein, putative n=1 Tax=Plasmodium reichenowi TaxID=5854 RepID=A0A2P9DSQ8_PLARE|nr:rifin PIR protein, putative [Plasmodium reichenowi]
MKLHYSKILLFVIPLNILIISLSNAHYKNNPSITPFHTPKIPTTRLLCECELYAPANYDNDPQMKEVIDNFNKQTQQRFHEYDDRMVEKRKQCKDKCDKEIQKIILKDKLEKELMDKFATLQTHIQSDAIPTCICEKSLADKVEKGCLRCARVLGGGVMPGMGLIDGSLLGAISVLQPAALKAAKAAALAEATDAAIEAGIDAVKLVIEGLMDIFPGDQGLVDLTKIVTPSNYNCGPSLVERARILITDYNRINRIKETTSFQNTAIYYSGESNILNFGQVGATTYETTLTTKTPVLEARNIASVNTTYASYQTAIIASIVAIVVIVLIMIIIYLILRYRRKKKMKKKLQYIKLLEE